MPSIVPLRSLFFYVIFVVVVANSLFITSRIATPKRFRVYEAIGVLLNKPLCDVKRRFFGVRLLAGNNGVNRIAYLSFPNPRKRAVGLFLINDYVVCCVVRNNSPSIRFYHAEHSRIYVTASIPLYSSNCRLLSFSSRLRIPRG